MPPKTLHIVLETGSISGGVRVVGEIANRLSARGWKVSIWSIHERQTMSWFPLDRRVEWVSFYRQGHTGDYDQLAHVLKKQAGYKLATYWATAFAVEFAAGPGEGLYLVQDIEVAYVPGPIQQGQVLRTYDLGLRHITTSQWVQTQIEAEWMGIGLDPFYKVLPYITIVVDTVKNKKGQAKRGHLPLACARRQTLKGYTQLCETAGYLAAAGFPLATYGQDDRLLMFASHKHVQNPTNSLLRDLYNASGAFVTTSLHEGLSLTPLEAMACGCPVVMTDADGNMEYAHDGQNCLIGTDPRDVADKTLRVLGDPALSRTLAAGGLETVKDYTWPAAITRLENILSDPA